MFCNKRTLYIRNLLCNKLKVIHPFNRKHIIFIIKRQISKTRWRKSFQIWRYCKLIYILLNWVCAIFVHTEIVLCFMHIHIIVLILCMFILKKYLGLLSLMLDDYETVGILTWSGFHFKQIRHVLIIVSKKIGRQIEKLKHSVILINKNSLIIDTRFTNVIYNIEWHYEKKFIHRNPC